MYKYDDKFLKSRDLSCPHISLMYLTQSRVSVGAQEDYAE